MTEKIPAIPRRKVLRLIAGAAAICGATALRLFGGAARAASRPPDTPPPAVPGYDWTKHRWAFGVDATRCIGCLSCVVACKKENSVPMDIHHFRTWVERYVYLDGSDEPVVDSESDPDVLSTSPGNPAYPYRFPDRYQGKKVDKAFFVPKLCNSCSNPPCVQVCPVGASFRTQDGVVLIDQDYCIGCRYCVQACPYGVRTFNEALGVADKCTWCYHRITKGLKPACVEACPAGARVFGDLNDPHSDISSFLRENRVNVLKPQMGTHPNVYYVGIDRSVR
jgi:tetrathionate reductase subunit B